MNGTVRWWWLIGAGIAGVMLGGFAGLQFTTFFFVDGYNVTKIAHIRTELVALENLHKGDLPAAVRLLESDLGYNEAYMQVALPDAAKSRVSDIQRVLNDVREYKARHQSDGK